MTQAAPLRLVDVDLTNLDQFAHADMHEVWRLLRAEAPVFWTNGTPTYPGFWSLTKYEGILEVSRDPVTFGSSGGIQLTTDPRTSHSLGKSMITSDPPRHAHLRQLVNKGFTPRMVTMLEPQIRGITVSILEEAARQARADFVGDIAARLPLAVICGMMGIPRDDWTLMFELTNRALGPDDAEYQTVAGDRSATRRQAAAEMTAYFGRLLSERPGTQSGDLVSILAGQAVPLPLGEGDSSTSPLPVGEGQGEGGLTNEESIHFCRLLIQAGNETTRNAISGGMLALIEHPAQRDILSADRTLVPIAVEEILRWVSPVLHMARTATRDAEISGQPIRAGERVVLWYPSANRDEDIFPEADRFDVRRIPNEHLAFGYGEHFCLGAGLARLELRVMFDELLQRLPTIELDGPIERLRSNFLGGIKHMPVRFG